MMWIPVALGPIGAAAGVAGFFSRRMAKTALPVASAAIVANGLQGTYLHARGIAQKPGGWSNARYNIEMGPPLLAPLLVTMVGGMGLLAAILRRETVTGQPRPLPAAAVRSPPRFPGFDVLGQARHWDQVTADLVTARLDPPSGLAFFTAAEAACAGVLLNLLTGQQDDQRDPRPAHGRRAAGRGRDRRLAVRRHARRRPGLAGHPGAAWTRTRPRAAATTFADAPEDDQLAADPGRPGPGGRATGTG